MYQTRKEGRKEGSPLRHRLNLPYHARSTSWLGEVDPMPFGGTKRRLHTLIRFQILSAKTFTHIIIYTWIFQLCHMFLNEKVEMSHSWKINTMSSLWHRYVESQKVTVTPREQNAFVLRAGNNPGHPSGSFSLCTDSRSPGAASPQAQSRGSATVVTEVPAARLTFFSYVILLHAWVRSTKKGLGCRTCSVVARFGRPRDPSIAEDSMNCVGPRPRALSNFWLMFVEQSLDVR